MSIESFQLSLPIFRSVRSDGWHVMVSGRPMRALLVVIRVNGVFVVTRTLTRVGVMWCGCSIRRSGWSRARFIWFGPQENWDRWLVWTLTKYGNGVTYLRRLINHHSCNVRQLILVHKSAYFVPNSKYVNFSITLGIFIHIWNWVQNKSGWVRMSTYTSPIFLTYLKMMIPTLQALWHQRGWGASSGFEIIISFHVQTVGLMSNNQMSLNC